MTYEERGSRLLYPVNSETRALLDLGGVWNFELGSFEEYDQELLQVPLSGGNLMAVPASYNDLGVVESIRGHVGWVRYETNFVVPSALVDDRVVLRFGSVTHYGKIYINGSFVGEHVGGFTRFEFEINQFIHRGQNRLTVVVNNVVDDSTLPVGTLNVTQGASGKKDRKE